MPNFTEIIKQKQIKRHQFNNKILNLARYGTPEYFDALHQRIEKLEEIKQIRDLLQIRLEECRVFNEKLEERLDALQEEIEGGAL